MLCVLASGCANKSAPVNLREKMLESSRRSDPDFPDEINEKLVHFAYFGDVQTKSGLLRVVDCKSVLTDMLSPHGKSWMAFFDESGAFVGRFYYDAPPLWCEGSKIIVWGLEGKLPPGHPVDSEGGNVWDLADGLAKLRLLTEERYGSYLKPESEGKIWK
jgi:hypothetical protein